MSSQEISKPQHVEIIQGEIVPNSLRTIRNPREGPGSFLPPSVIANDEKGKLWINVENLGPPEKDEDRAVTVRKSTNALANEIDYTEHIEIMQVEGFVRRRRGKEPLFLPWKNTISLWIPFDGYSESAKREVKKEWEKYFQSQGIDKGFNS